MGNTTTGTPVSTVIVQASCAPGSSWDTVNSRCVPGLVLTINADDCEIPIGDFRCTTKPTSLTNYDPFHDYDLINDTTNDTTAEAYRQLNGWTFNPDTGGTAAELYHGVNVLKVREAASGSGPASGGSILSIKNVTARCVTGASWNTVTNRCAVAVSDGISATLVGSDCTIDHGANACSGSFTWNIQGAANPNLYNATRLVEYSTSPSGNQEPYTIGYGANTVQVRNGNTVLGQKVVKGTCAFGTAWNAGLGKCWRSYTVRPTVIGSGSIAPNIATTVLEGDDLSFVMNAFPGFSVRDVRIKSGMGGWLSLGPVASHEFTNVAADKWIEVTFAVPPPATPGSMLYSCPAPGSLAEVSWSAVNGATFYSLRVDNTTTGGWGNSCDLSAGDFCEDLTDTSKTFVSVVDNSYKAWVHACSANGCSVNAASVTFTCVPTNAPIITLIANPGLINPGDSSTLIWTVANAASCTAAGSPAWSGNVDPAGGNRPVSPAATTTYELECTSPQGVTAKKSIDLFVAGISCNNGIPEPGEQCDSPAGNGSCPNVCALDCKLNNCGAPINSLACIDPQAQCIAGCDPVTQTAMESCNSNQGTCCKPLVLTSVNGTIEVTNPINFNDFQGVFGSILGTLQAIIAILALIFIVIGGILYMTAAGDEGRAKLAKGAITAAMVGLALGVAAPSFLKQIGDILGWGAIPGPVAGRSFIAIATGVLNFLLSITGIIAVIMLVVGGLMYMTSGGDEDRATTGKKIVKYSIIGIVIALGALVIVRQLAVFFA
jgi:hypothetical protein